eukprot:2008088-Rhodomonas_salina.2
MAAVPARALTPVRTAEASRTGGLAEAAAPAEEPAAGGGATRKHDAKGVICDDTPGAVDVFVKCNTCGLPGDGGLGHRLFKCAQQFDNYNPGKTMPCFDAIGAKIPGAWQGNDITAATMQGQGYFKIPPVTGDPGSMQGIRG